jgi:hypothetical protein
MVTEQMAGNLVLPALTVQQAAQTLVLGHLQVALPRLVLRVLEALAAVPTQLRHTLAAQVVSPAAALVVVAHQSQAASQAQAALVVLVL